MANFSSMDGPRPYDAAAIAQADAFIGKGPHRLFIDGQWRDADGGKRFDIVDPASGEVLAQAASGGPADVDQAVRAAARAFRNPDWRAMNPHARGSLLERVARLMEEHAEELAVIQSRDLGADPALSRALVAGGIEAFRYYAGWPTKILGDTMPGDGASLSFTVREPLGVVGAIIP